MANRMSEYDSSGTSGTLLRGIQSEVKKINTGLSGLSAERVNQLRGEECPRRQSKLQYLLRRRGFGAVHVVSAHFMFIPYAVLDRDVPRPHWAE